MKCTNILFLWVVIPFNKSSKSLHRAERAASTYRLATEMFEIWLFELFEVQLDCDCYRMGSRVRRGNWTFFRLSLARGGLEKRAKSRTVPTKNMK